MENPLAEEAGPFPLTLRDIFTNSYVVEVRPEMPVFEVKELVRAAKGESIEFVDAAVLLFDGQPLDDESTVGSHSLSRRTTVTLSNQDASKGRERRRERGKFNFSFFFFEIEEEEA